VEALEVRVFGFRSSSVSKLKLLSQRKKVEELRQKRKSLQKSVVGEEQAQEWTRRFKWRVMKSVTESKRAAKKVKVEGRVEMKGLNPRRRREKRSKLKKPSIRR